MINIIVCMKQVLDPEAPASTFSVDAAARKVVQRGVPPVLNPYDENALEAALRIKGSQESQITVISMGRSISKPIARKALAAGASAMVILEDAAFEELDSYGTASVLAGAIGRLGKYDVIFTGRQAADTNAGVVGSALAEILGIPCVTIARKVELNSGRAKVERVISDGYEVIEVPLPALITVSHESGSLRSVNVRELMAAQKMPITTWNAADLGIQPSQMNRTRLVNLSIPTREVKCEMVKGESEEESGKNLASKLKGAGLF